MDKLKSEDPSFSINHRMRNRMTIEYLGLWAALYNPDFKPLEFGRFRKGDSQATSATMRPSTSSAEVGGRKLRRDPTEPEDPHRGFLA